MKLSLFILIILMSSSCRYQESLSSLKNLENGKKELSAIENENLTVQNQEILRSYFLTAGDLFKRFKSDVRFQNYFHKKFFRYFDENLCEKIFISKSLYNNLSLKCHVSGFYICPDEFRAFEALVGEFFFELTEIEKKKLKNSSQCETLLKEWELNEN